MGYRSNVLIGTTKEAYEKLMVEMEKAFPVDEYDESYLSSMSEYVNDIELDGIPHVKVMFEGIKWYHTFTDIALIERILIDEVRDDGNDKHHICMIEIGQEYNDITTIGDTSEFGVYVSTSIEDET